MVGFAAAVRADNAGDALVKDHDRVIRKRLKAVYFQSLFSRTCATPFPSTRMRASLCLVQLLQRYLRGSLTSGAACAAPTPPSARCRPRGAPWAVNTRACGGPSCPTISWSGVSSPERLQILL